MYRNSDRYPWRECVPGYESEIPEGYEVQAFVPESDQEAERGLREALRRTRGELTNLRGAIHGRKGYASKRWLAEWTARIDEAVEVATAALASTPGLSEEQLREQLAEDVTAREHRMDDLAKSDPTPPEQGCTTANERSYDMRICGDPDCPVHGSRGGDLMNIAGHFQELEQLRTALAAVEAERDSNRTMYESTLESCKVAEKQRDTALARAEAAEARLEAVREATHIRTGHCSECGRKMGPDSTDFYHTMSHGPPYEATVIPETYAISNLPASLLSDPMAGGGE